MPHRRLAGAGLLVTVALVLTAIAQARGGQAVAPARTPAGEQAFRALYKELVEINTTLSSGSCTRAANAMKTHLVSAGYPAADLTVVIPPARPKDGNLIALLHGTDATLKPVLLLAHIDVVEAKREDWKRDPFTLTEEGGYFYARGAVDDKAMAAIFTDAMVRFRQEGYRPRRGIKLALTCGEETPGTFNGVRYLVQNHRALIDAAFAINEGGGGRLNGKTGKYEYNGIEAGQKLYQDFTLDVVNQGGHSARPRPDNAIYQIVQALAKVQAFEFPIEFNDATRGYLQKYGDIIGGAGGADMKGAAAGDTGAIARVKMDPSVNGMLHTTCVATMITGGHAKNALPQHVTANVNCRIVPGHQAEEVRQTLITVVNDPGVKIDFEAEPEKGGPAPPLTPAILGPIEKVTNELFPGAPVLPTQSSGANDGRFLTPVGIPTYGVSGLFTDPDTTNTHGLNERIPVKSLMEGREFLFRLVKEYASK